MTTEGWRSEARAFRDFEHAGWQRVPARYHDAFAGLTSQAAEPLLDAAAVTRGTRLLDLATGPGYVAAAAAGRGARVVGIDFSPAMVEHARQRHPDIDFQEGDAEELPFGDARFDAVVMNFGLLHLARPERALGEANRVLRRGGRFAFSVWAPRAESIAFDIVLRAVEAHGRLDVPLPPGPPFFRFSDPAECVRALDSAGFEDARVARTPQTWRIATADALFEIMEEGTVRTAGLLRAQSPDARAAIRDAVREEAARHRIEGAVVLPMPAVLASAVKG